MLTNKVPKAAKHVKALHNFGSQHLAHDTL